MSKVILTVIDGCRVDALEKANTPHLDGLADRGVRAMASTVEPPVTLPVHFSIFTGMTPFNHGVLCNAGRPHPSPAAISFIDLARQHGLTTAAFYNWEFLRELSSPGMLSHAFFAGEPDERILDSALAFLSRRSPDFAFIYLGGLDMMGHDHGWMSGEYLAYLEQADRLIGRLITHLNGNGLKNTYDLIVLSDHGGVDNSHEKPAPEIMAVPWLAMGPDIKRGAEIGGSVSLLDTAPTMARLLGLPILPQWQGKVLEEILW